jgi:hypothetical protein
VVLLLLYQQSTAGLPRLYYRLVLLLLYQQFDYRGCNSVLYCCYFISSSTTAAVIACGIAATLSAVSSSTTAAVIACDIAATLSAVSSSTTAAVIACGIAARYDCFGSTCYLHRRGKTSTAEAELMKEQ